MKRNLLLLFIFMTSAASSMDVLSVRDLDGNFLTFPSNEKKALVIYFADTTCPVANQYVPRLNEFFSEYRDQGIEFLFVYPDRAELWPVARHINEYKIKAPAFIDYDGVIGRQFKPKVLSEVVVVDRNLKTIYQGRIDDQFSVGQRAPEPRTNELKAVLEAIKKDQETKVEWHSASGCSMSPSERSKGEGQLTYMKDIAPLIKNHCHACHQDSGTAPFSLSSYAEVSRLAPAIALVLKEFRMPPWFSDSDPSQFVHPTYLPLEQRQRILNWIASGTPRGTGAERKWPNHKSGWTLGRPDYVIEVPDSEIIPASGRGYFKEFAVDLKNKSDLWVDKVEVLPDQVKAVHHVTIYTRKKGQKTPEEYEGERWGYFSAFVPGSGPTVLPKGLAKRVPSGYELLVNIHYVPIGREVRDHSKIALYYSRIKKPTELLTDSVRSMDFEIPPGIRFHEVVAERTLKEDIRLKTIVPHAHYRGRSFLVKAIQPDGTQRELLSVPKFSISWQSAYTFKESISLKKGTKLICQVTYDNSNRNPINPDAKVKVVFGPQSDDEMMFCYFDYLVKEQKSEEAKIVSAR